VGREPPSPFERTNTSDVRPPVLRSQLAAPFPSCIPVTDSRLIFVRPSSKWKPERPFSPPLFWFRWVRPMQLVRGVAGDPVFPNPFFLFENDCIPPLGQKIPLTPLFHARKTPFLLTVVLQVGGDRRLSKAGRASSPLRICRLA